MKTLLILLMLVAVILSGFARDAQRTDAGVVVPMKFEGVTGHMTLTGIHTESGIPISGEGFISFPK